MYYRVLLRVDNCTDRAQAIANVCVADFHCWAEMAHADDEGCMWKERCIRENDGKHGRGRACKNGGVRHHAPVPRVVPICGTDDGGEREKGNAGEKEVVWATILQEGRRRSVLGEQHLCERCGREKQKQHPQ